MKHLLNRRYQDRHFGNKNRRRTLLSTERVLPMVNTIFEMNGKKRRKNVEDGIDGKVREILGSL
jgi:hypothetical protein